MKNDNWKYFGHLEIIWKIGINCKLRNFFDNFGKNLKKLKIQKKIGKLGGKNWTFGKKWKFRKNCKFRIFFEMLEKFGNFKKVWEKFGNFRKICKKHKWKFEKRNWKFEKKPSKYGKICKLGKKLEIWKIILKFEKNMKNFEI